MTNIRETIRGALQADSAIIAIVDVGNIFDAQTFDTPEGVIPDTVRGATGGILPFMVLRFTGSRATDPEYTSNMIARGLAVYIYNGRGYNTIETLKTHVKRVLRDKFFSGDDMGVCKLVLGGDLGENTAPEMEHAYLDAVNFQLVGWEN